ERTRALLHLLTLNPAEKRSPILNFDVLMGELASFDPELAKRPMIVAMSQADRPEVRDAFPAVQKAFRKWGIDIRLISAVTGEGMKELMRDLYRIVRGETVAPVPGERAPAAKKKAPPKKKSVQATKATRRPKKKS